MFRTSAYRRCIAKVAPTVRRAAEKETLHRFADDVHDSTT